jgi:hypothetical protein
MNPSKSSRPALFNQKMPREITPELIPSLQSSSPKPSPSRELHPRTLRPLSRPQDQSLSEKTGRRDVKLISLQKLFTSKYISSLYIFIYSIPNNIE